MKADRKLLTETLRYVDSAIDHSAVAPVYRLIRLFAADGRFFAAGTDLDVIVIANCECDGDLPEICVDSRTLLSVVRNAPADAEYVDISLTGNQAVIKAEKSRFKIAIWAEAVPEFTQQIGADHVTTQIDGTALSTALRSVKYAADAGNGRVYLEGIYLHSRDGVIRAAAMDGIRLAVADIAAGEMRDVIIPTKTAGIVAAFDGLVDVTVGSTGMMVQTDRVRLISKVIDGQFPAYERLIPPPESTVIVFNGKELRRAAQRVADIMSEKTRVVRVEFGGGVARISAISQTGNEAEDEVPVFGGDGITLGVNIKLLNDALAMFGDTDIEMVVKDNMSPVLVREVGGGGVFALLTLFRLNN